RAADGVFEGGIVVCHGRNHTPGIALAAALLSTSTAAGPATGRARGGCAGGHATAGRRGRAHLQPRRLQRRGPLRAYALDAVRQVVERGIGAAASAFLQDGLRHLGPYALDGLQRFGGGLV